jgi:hypothetical protein
MKRLILVLVVSVFVLPSVSTATNAAQVIEWSKSYIKINEGGEGDAEDRFMAAIFMGYVLAVAEKYSLEGVEFCPPDDITSDNLMRAAVRGAMVIEAMGEDDPGFLDQAGWAAVEVGLRNEWPCAESGE